MGPPSDGQGPAEGADVGDGEAGGAHGGLSTEEARVLHTALGGHAAAVRDEDVPGAAGVDASDEDGEEVNEGYGVGLAAGSSAVTVNGVAQSAELFKERVHDFMAYVFSSAHNLTREAIGDYLTQQSRLPLSRTPYLLESFVSQSVHLGEKHVDACRNGCLAFTASREGLTHCSACGAARRGPDGRPVKVVVYWPLTPWLRAMLADPVMGPGLVEAMARARAAAESPRDGVHDWWDGEIFRTAVAKGYFLSNTSIALSISTDGFEAWRQQGFQGWPIVATVLSLPSCERSRVVAQLLLCVTPGPRQPHDLESFMHAIAEELNILAAGVGGVAVAGAPTAQVLHAYVLQFTTDMPAGDKLLNMTGHNGARPNRDRDFTGVRHGSHYYFPPVDPRTKLRLFSIRGPPTAPRSATTLAAGAAAVHSTRASGRSRASIQALTMRLGVKSHSLWFAPTLDDQRRYPHLSYWWEVGPVGAPYDPMHLILQNVVPLLWRLFSGDYGALGGDAPEAYVMSPADAQAASAEIAAARRTVPLSQARSLRNIATRNGSYKAVDWMVFVLSTREAVLFDRLPPDIYKMFMALARACRLLFRPRGVSEAELLEVDKNLKEFCAAFYSSLYGGLVERLPLCRSTVVALLDVVALLRACGPAWVFCQFPIERYIGTLPDQIRSSSKPHAALCNSISRKYRAELITTFAETRTPEAWALASGRPRAAAPTAPARSYVYSKDQSMAVTLLPPVREATPLSVTELEHLHAALALEGTPSAAPPTQVRRFAPLQMQDGTVAGSLLSWSERDPQRRRDHVVSVASTVRSRQGRPGTEDLPANVFGRVHQLDLVSLGDALRAFACIECNRSGADRAGVYGLAKRKQGMDCFTSLGGSMRFADVLAIDAVVGTLESRGKHIVLYPRERFGNYDC